MKLYQETRLQAWMIVSTAIGLITVLVLLAAGLIQNHIPYLIYAGIDLIIIFIVISIGHRRALTVVARVKKIREGGGDADDLEWLKSRKSPGFTKVSKK